MPFRIALSGLNAAAADLRVIGNNVANASTTGFKKSNAEFADVYAASTTGVSSNAVGAGVKISAIKQEFSQGNIDFTNNNLDMAISGEGFFRLSDNGATKYSRAGAFGVDREGYIVNSENLRLTGNLADANGSISNNLGEIQMTTEDLDPSATSLVTMSANLDSSQTAPGVAFSRTDASTYNHSTSLTTYDSQGNSVLQTLYFQKDSANTWNMFSYLDHPTAGGLEMIPSGGVTGDPVVLAFTTGGAINTATPGSGQVAAYEDTTVAGFDDIVGSINVSGLTQFGSSFGVNKLVQNGFSDGRLSGVEVSDEGIISARYTNGQSQNIAQIAMANFSNQNGLVQLGDNTWAETAESGAALVGSAGTGALGLIQSGALEGSNVDLTEQLVSMITSQRNFQANAKIIETADTVTQTILNIR